MDRLKLDFRPDQDNLAKAYDILLDRFHNNEFDYTTAVKHLSETKGIPLKNAFNAVSWLMQEGNISLPDERGEVRGMKVIYGNLIRGNPEGADIRYGYEDDGIVLAVTEPGGHYPVRFVKGTDKRPKFFGSPKEAKDYASITPDEVFFSSVDPPDERTAIDFIRKDLGIEKPEEED